MSLMPITAAAERAQRVRAAGERHHANATCVFNGGQPFGVVYRRAHKDALGIVGGYGPICSFCVVNAPGVEQGAQLVIDGQPFEVVCPVEPDASGWATLQLREVAHG